MSVYVTACVYVRVHVQVGVSYVAMGVHVRACVRARVFQSRH